MKVTCRKAVAEKDGEAPRVVMEVWMTREEAILLSLQQPLTDLEETEQSTINEHLKTGFRVTRNVTRGRPL